MAAGLFGPKSCTVTVKNDNNLDFFEAEIEHSEDLNGQNRFAAIEANEVDEGSSQPENLRNSSFLDLDVEADCSGFSKYSNMNRVVSSILRNRKNDADDGLSKKRRQRLTNEQQLVLE